jgi:hypothetical protein
MRRNRIAFGLLLVAGFAQAEDRSETFGAVIRLRRGA